MSKNDAKKANEESPTEVSETQEKTGLLTGRPSKYTAEYANKLLGILEKGHTVQEAAAQLKISRDTLYRWSKDHEEFGDALRTGKEWSEAANIAILRQGSLGQIPKFNPTGYAMLMNNCYGWSRNQEGQASINIQNMNVFQNQSKDQLLEFIQQTNDYLNDNGIKVLDLEPSEYTTEIKD